MSIYFQKISNARAHQQTRKMAKWKRSTETEEKHCAKDMKTGKGQVKS